MNKFHQELLGQIKKHAGKGTKQSASDSYIGSGHFYYSLSNPIKRQICKDWIKIHKEISIEEFTDLLDSLYKAPSYEEKTSAGMLLGYLPKLRNQVDLNLLGRWLGELNGWAEVDGTCQSSFTAKELLENWDSWQKFIRKLSGDKNINKKRASLVLLTGPVSKSEYKKLSGLAFEVVDRLKTEKSILITKAISWLLRSLVRYHKEEVVNYLEENQNTLPKIAIRETQRKLLTGRK